MAGSTVRGPRENAVRLYGRRRVLDFVTAALRRRGAPEQPLPLLLLTGPRGSGGTALLGRIREECGADCLTARLDLADAQGTDDAVLAAMRGLAERVPGVRPVNFPLMGAAVKALTYDGDDRQGFEAYMRAARRYAGAGDRLDVWAERAAPLLATPGHQFLAFAVTRTLTGLLGRLSGRQERAVQDWFAARLPRAGSAGGYEPLWYLHNRSHEATSRAAREVAGALCAALLTDLAADFHDTGLRHGRRLEKGFAKFGDRAGHRTISRPPYDTTDRDRNAKSAQDVRTAEGIVRDSLSRMAQNICDAQRTRPTLVLFAGRGRDLAILVRALADGCSTTPVTLLSGDDVTNLPLSALHGVDWHNITVEYAGVAAPDEWKHAPARDPAARAGAQGYRDFAAAFARLSSRPAFRGARLSDGNTMMAYDAVYTAATAIRMTGGKDLPSPRAVTSALGALNGRSQVLGSSGPISFSADYGTGHGSDPIGKPVPVLRLERDGGSRVITVDRPQPPATP